MSEQFITHGPLRIWTSETGKGPPVLLIAGANASGLMWPDAFVAMLAAAGYRVIRYDHRDTGRSSRGGPPYGIADLAADAVAVLDGLGIARAHVVGLSLGATLGQVLALDHPDRLLSLTLMMGAALDVDFAGNWARAYAGEPAAGPLPGPRAEVIRAFAAPLADHTAELDRRVAQWRLLSPPGAPFDAADFRAREDAEIRHAGVIPAPTAHAAATPIPLERGRELAQIRLPVLVIQAMDDPLNPPPHGRHLADLIPDAQLVEIASLGHALPQNHLAPLAEMLTQFWHGHAGPSPDIYVSDSSDS